MLNGIGLVFLLFVLVEFLKEGRRGKLVGVCDSRLSCAGGARPSVVVAVQPPADEAARLMRRRLIQFRARKDAPSESKLAGKTADLLSGSARKSYGAR
jgi:hypothetical protein